MDQSLKLQMDVKNNAEDLRNYVLDLNNWVDEMNKKEKSLNNEKPPESNIPPPRNKIKRSKPAGESNQSGKPIKISAYDYSAWDKFDVEKACAEIDMEGSNKNEEEEEVSDEDIGENIPNEKIDKKDSNLSLIDEAFFEKEMGNSFVKKEQWGEAIKCYTNAINLDPKNAVYYANRSLCFLKLKNLKAAETDATTALQLDKKYIKAYQRRAFARQALGQLAEARADYEEILKLEPKNSLARLEINKINEKLNKENVVKKPVEKPTFSHKDIFKKDESKPKSGKTVQSESKKINTVKSESTPAKLEISKSEIKTEKLNQDGGRKLSVLEKGDGDKKTQSKVCEVLKVFKPLPEGCRIVHPVNIPPHRRSKKPLRRIEIVEGDNNEKKKPPEETKTMEKKEVTIFSKLNECALVTDDRLALEVPKSAVQFQKSWIVVRKNPEEAYSYLKKISRSSLPQIFQNSLESDFFSELIGFLANHVKKEADVVYDFLFGLSKVKRFSSLVMFMSNADKTNVKKCISQVEKVKSMDEILELYKLYEL